MSSTMRIENLLVVSVDGGSARGIAPGAAAAEPALPATSAPGPAETKKLATTLGGNAIEQAMLLQLRDFQEQGRSARKEQMANREAHLAEARSEYRHHVRQAEETRQAAIEGAVLAGASIVAGAGFGGDESSKLEQGTVKVVQALPDLHSKLDAAIGHGAAAARQGLAAEAADYRSEYAGKREEDAADRAKEMKESQSRVLDLLQEALRGQSESRASATRA